MECLGRLGLILETYQDYYYFSGPKCCQSLKITQLTSQSHHTTQYPEVMANKANSHDWAYSRQTCMSTRSAVIELHIETRRGFRIRHLFEIVMAVEI